MNNEVFEEYRKHCELCVKSSITNVYTDIERFSMQWGKIGHLLAIVEKEAEEVTKALKKEEAKLFVELKSSPEKPSDMLVKNMVLASDSLDDLRSRETEANYRVACLKGYYDALVAKRQFLSKIADNIQVDEKNQEIFE